MPAKGRRVAVRQAELRSRRRRPGPAVDGAGAATPESGVATAERASDVPVSSPGPASATPARASGLVQRRSGARARAEQISAYSYVGAEMRRIAIVTAGVVAILVVLTFLLK